MADGPAAELREGEVAEGYRVERVLGRGGMSVVYRACRLRDEACVALKVLSAEKSADNVAVARFKQEAKVLRQIQHDNVVRVFDVGSLPDGRCFLVMEHLGGRNLAQHLKTTGAIGLDRALSILVPIAAALDVVHAAGIVHRDIKPSNIFLHQGAKGVEIKLLDFGIAKVLDGTALVRTMTDQLAGSPYYMSPEQCRGSRVDYRSDLYSLGLVAFELLAGRRAHSPNSLGDLLLLQQTQVVSLRQFVPGCSRQLDRALQRATHKEAKRRHRSAAELVIALAAAGGLKHTVSLPSVPSGVGVEGREGPMAPFSQTVTLQPRARRTSSTAAILAGALLAAAVAVIAIVMMLPDVGDSPQSIASPAASGHPSASMVDAQLEDIARRSGSRPSQDAAGVDLAVMHATHRDAHPTPVGTSRTKTTSNSHSRRRKRSPAPRRRARRKAPKKAPKGQSAPVFDMPVRFGPPR